MREALSEAARRLVLEHGLDAVTVEAIASDAGVSTRTFFNYFPTKDDAIVGFEPSAIAEHVQLLRDRPADESPAAALAAVFFTHAGANADGLLQQWEQHNELVRRHPALFPRYLASMAEVEAAMGAALAERHGLDPGADPRPQALVASTMAVLRSTVSWWLESDRSEALLEVLRRSYDALIPDTAVL